MEKIASNITAFLPWEDVESEAKEQIFNTASLPFLYHHVAVMPDVHFGKGATAVIFMDSQRFCTASLRRKCCELVSKSFTVSSIRGVDANPRATTLSQYLQNPIAHNRSYQDAEGHESNFT